MIRSLTIIGNEKAPGVVEYSINGDLPLDEASRAITLFALQVPRVEKKKEDIKVPDQQ